MPVADQPSLAPAVFHSPVLWERANGTVGSTDVCHGDARLVIEASHAPARNLRLEDVIPRIAGI
jgi:hypothetical protein